MKMKKWLKCLLMTMALMMVVNVGAISTTIPVAAKASAKTIKVGTKFQSGKFQYKVTSLSGNTGTATLVGTKSKKLTSVNVPETVKKGKYTLTVDAIGDNAFKNCKKLKSVATNTKIKKIGKNAFKGCKKLATVDIKSTELKSVGKNALKGISKKAVVTAPAGTADSYEDMLGVEVEAPVATAQVFAAKDTTASKPVVQSEKAQQTEAPATEAPKQTETQAEMKAPATEAPKATETEATKVTETEAAETPAQTEAARAVETEAPKATETPGETTPAAPAAPRKRAAAPKAAQTPKQTETETPAQTEAPATEVPKQTETEAPTTEAPTEAPKQTETSAQTEAPATEAPVETEHVCEFEWVVTKEPICGYLKNDMTWRDTGSRTGTCKVCGKTVTEGLRAEHHLVVTKNMEPTCTTRGATYSKCEVCGYESITFKDENGNIRKALGHNMVHHEDPATCTEDGYSYDECSRCGLVQNKKMTEKKTGHDFTPETVTEGVGFRSAVKDPKEAYIEREPSCTLVGIEKIPCQHDDCGVVKTQYIPATGHDLQKEEIAATCLTDKKDVYTCANCDYSETKVEYGTRHGHTLAEERREESTTTKQGYVLKGCTECDYEETTPLALAKCEHKWAPVSETKGHEGVLASMSYKGKIRTEKCTECGDLRYAYNTAGDDKEAKWVPWEEVVCNGKGHTWQEGPQEDGHTYCTVCGTVKPESEENGRNRIVWSATFKAGHTECVGFKLPDGGWSYSAVLTTISAANTLKVQAPAAHPGYVFDHWSWSHGDKIPSEILSTTTAENDTLTIGCEYMDVVFTANYRVEGTAPQTENQESAPISEPTGTTQTIHGTMEIDLDLGDASSVATHDHEVEEHGEALHEGEHMTEMPIAPAEAVTESSTPEEAVME